MTKLKGLWAESPLSEGAKALQERCLALGIHFSSSESCTGGRIAAAVTAVPGSSAYYAGGLVAYTVAQKMASLKVKKSTLDRFTVYSEEVAQEMATGTIAFFGSDLAVATTGIAGPGGGSDEQPVGLVCIAVATAGSVYSFRHVFTGSREEIQEEAVRWSLYYSYDCIEREWSDKSLWQQKI